MSKYDPNAERRKHYAHFLTIPTQWRDVDMYQHVNNVVFYAYFDTVINQYLIRQGVLQPETGEVIGFAVESKCQFLEPVVFPDILEAGLRIGHVGNSSCRYEIAIFKQGSEKPSAVGYFVHVFVNRETTRPTPITGQLRVALENLMVDV